MAAPWLSVSGLIFLVLALVAQAQVLQVCDCCAGSVRSSSMVASFCASRHGATLHGRCCLDRDPQQEAAVVVGLDLGNCSLHQLCPSFQEARTSLIIDLTDNPLSQFPEDAFRGFTQLHTLTLPQERNCPGGSSAWAHDDVQGSSRICQDLRNPCNGSEGLAWVCPEDSLCVPDGPGLPQCLCAGPYHGYKCLRQGTFPYLLFYGTLGTITTSLSILLWTTQRRKAKSS